MGQHVIQYRHASVQYTGYKDVLCLYLTNIKDVGKLAGRACGAAEVKCAYEELEGVYNTSILCVSLVTACAN